MSETHNVKLTTFISGDLTVLLGMIASWLVDHKRVSVNEIIIVNDVWDRTYNASVYWFRGKTYHN